MAKNKNIEALNKIGQSIWYDNLSRDILLSGELKGLVEQGVSGLTSNPTIFQKAISGSATYDNDLKKLVQQKVAIPEIVETLMVSDVANAADLLRPVYDATNGGDGYTSIEVSPLLARDTEGTLVEARRLWNQLRRPNIMIKVPATKEGIPAIQTLISEGINVNVTLIFSVAVYAKVMEAYLSGVETLLRNNKNPKVASVASFFVSRVDSICEKYFDQRVASKEVDPSKKDLFFGKIGIANSKLAFRKFEETFNSARFEKLKSKGAWIQRPLWASTGTKNPAFSPTLYVEELAGPNTVNTVPPQTLTALMEKLTARSNIKENLTEADRVVASIDSLGLNFNKLLVELEDAGVKLFADSYNSLISDVTTKCNKIK